jgi:hypothetical protein
MATYRFPSMLTLLAWEAQLRHGAYADERAWSQPNQADPLELDFSRVEFADFGALARVLLLLDTAARSGIPAIVTLPVTSAFVTGDQSDKDSVLAARRAQARGDALALCGRSGFSTRCAPRTGRGVLLTCLIGPRLTARSSFPGPPRRIWTRGVSPIGVGACSHSAGWSRCRLRNCGSQSRS